MLRDTYGVEDNWPVFCEEFRQWVVEDKFPAGRPALEKVGVTFTADVAPYELMKIRILNGGHAAIAYPAGLLDIHFVHEAMEDAADRAFLEKLTKREIMPVVPPPPASISKHYREDGRRTLRQSEDRRHDHAALPRRLEPPAEVHPADGRATDRAAGASVKGLALVSAMWCRYCYGESESGKAIPPNDPSWDRLQAAAKPARDDPRAFLAMRDIFGELADDPTYVAAFSSALGSLWTNGVRATLADYLQGEA